MSGLIGIDVGIQALGNHTEPSHQAVCSEMSANVCRHLGEPIDAYVEVISGGTDKAQNLTKVDIVLVGMGAVALATGSAVLVHATYQQITDSLKGVALPNAPGLGA